MTKAFGRWMSDKTLEEEQSPRRCLSFNTPLCPILSRKSLGIACGSLAAEGGARPTDGTLGQWQ
jgi:hypothetical protein